MSPSRLRWRWEEQDFGFRFRAGFGRRAVEHYQAEAPGDFYVVPASQAQASEGAGGRTCRASEGPHGSPPGAEPVEELRPRLGLDRRPARHPAQLRRVSGPGRAASTRGRRRRPGQRVSDRPAGASRASAVDRAAGATGALRAVRRHISVRRDLADGHAAQGRRTDEMAAPTGRHPAADGAPRTRTCSAGRH